MSSRPVLIPRTRLARRLRAMFIVACIAAGSANALAQSRWVFVNGQRLSDAQLGALERRSCAEIPDGAYWLNPSNGAWGYAGNPQVQGVLGQSCAAAANSGAGINPDGTRGPFATMRRAEQEANAYRAQGYRAVAFHNGDGYYIRVSR